MIDLTATDLTALTAVELRKTGAAAGIKGASKGKKGDLLPALEAIKAEQIEEQELRAETARRNAETERVAVPGTSVTAPAPKKGACIVCGKRRGMSAATLRQQGLAKDFSDQCLPCYEEAGWENSHSDSNHEGILATPEADRTEAQRAEIDGCWICFPELNLAKAEPKMGRSRAGMVIIAKGTEYHKSATFKAAAEAAGWSVTVQEERYEVAEGEEGHTRYFATATRGDDSISLAWDGRAYDYPASSARLNGKDRKVRNLKEALRLI